MKRIKGNARKTVMYAAAICSAVLFLTGCVQTGSDTGSLGKTEQERSISVSASVQTEIVPDQAEIQFQVISSAEDAASCQAANAEDVNTVLAYLQEQGITEESIQTSDLHMTPNYDWNSGNGNQIIGYEMSTSITVKNIEAERLGTLLQAAVEEGINSIRGISYEAGSYEEAYQEALNQAIEKARQKAETMAATAGAELGEIIRITESSVPSSVKSSSNQSMLYSGAEAAADMNIMPGTVAAEASVQVEFALK